MVDRFTMNYADLHGFDHIFIRSSFNAHILNEIEWTAKW